MCFTLISYYVVEFRLPVLKYKSMLFVNLLSINSFVINKYLLSAETSNFSTMNCLGTVISYLNPYQIIWSPHILVPCPWCDLLLELHYQLKIAFPVHFLFSYHPDKKTALFFFSVCYFLVTLSVETCESIHTFYTEKPITRYFALDISIMAL
jgi:hypothetical protein